MSIGAGGVLGSGCGEGILSASFCVGVSAVISLGVEVGVSVSGHQFRHWMGVGASIGVGVGSGIRVGIGAGIDLGVGAGIGASIHAGVGSSIGVGMIGVGIGA